jgi:hypothetical protein
MAPRGDRLRWPPRRSRRQGGTRQTLSTDEQKPAPRQPNERDESPDSQASGPRTVMRQAAADIEQGQEDTDCRNQAAEIIDKRRKDSSK